jgi:RNA polymerase sigma-70 factor (ECF subfamily)
MRSAEDTAWFIEQVRQEHTRLRAFIRSLGVRAEAVDDVAQECFILALEKLDQFERGTDFGAWVRGMARRLVMNLLRKEQRRQLILSDAVTHFMADTADEPVDDTTAERAEALRACVGQLPERSRELVRMRYFEDLTPGAIASLLERTANDVRQILFRLRRALLDCVEKRLREENS